MIFFIASTSARRICRSSGRGCTVTPSAPKRSQSMATRATSGLLPPRELRRVAALLISFSKNSFSAFQIFHKMLGRQIIRFGGKKYALVQSCQYIKRLRIVVEAADLQIGILFSNGFFYFVVVGGSVPFVFGQFCFVIHIKRDYNEIVFEALQYGGVAPHASFHFPTVGAAVPGEVDEEGFLLLAGAGHRFVVVEIAANAMRQMQKLGIFRG